MEIKFIKKPAFSISGIRKYPEPNTTAFGGVATGSIKAQDAAAVHATKSMKGSTSKDRASGAITGNIIAVVAKLDVTSVRKLTQVIINSNNTNKGSPSKKIN